MSQDNESLTNGIPSNKEEQLMKIMVAFIAGTLLGVVAALLLAPESGEDLRAQIRTEAASERNNLSDDYKKVQQETHDKIDKMHQELSAAINKGS